MAKGSGVSFLTSGRECGGPGRSSQGDGASWKAWRGARTARGETRVVCGVSAARAARTEPKGRQGERGRSRSWPLSRR